MIENASRNSQGYTSVWGVLQQIVKHILIFSKDNLQQLHQRDFQWVLPRGEDLDQLGYQLDITCI